MSNQQPNQQQVQIKINDDIIRGAYSNNMQVMHTKEEFVIDFMNILPPNGIVNARVIVSPGHMKRMIKTLTENLKKYEDQHGEVKTAENPNEIGFKA